MRVLVGYATRYGATQGIAERIAKVLSAANLDVETRPMKSAEALGAYDGFVVGSALYMGHWMPEALEFVRRHRAELAQRPVWLFSSGPLGTARVDAGGRDVREGAEPVELPELRGSLYPRDHRVFFGALNPKKLNLRDRIVRALPAGKALLPEGDFRDWPEIDAWAMSVAREAAHLSYGVHAEGPHA